MEKLGPMLCSNPLSPVARGRPGFGQDCHRTWEALYLGVVPVVSRTCLTDHSDLYDGLPVSLLPIPVNLFHSTRPSTAELFNARPIENREKNTLNRPSAACLLRCEARRTGR